MGTHPIFESDFDCLTEKKMAYNRGKEERERLFQQSANYQRQQQFNSHQPQQTALDMEGAHYDKLSRANQNMDNILGNANSVLDSMYSQRESLKGIKGKMMNIANQLGMSQTVMRLINKRSDQDRLILWGGMFITTVIMFLIWKYFG